MSEHERSRRPNWVFVAELSAAGLMVLIPVFLAWAGMAGYDLLQPTTGWQPQPEPKYV